jgi:hypothetical protein
MSYEEYICSPQWRWLRAAALYRDGRRYRKCGSRKRLEVHHRWYPPHGRWERDTLKALITLCAACHGRVTFWQRVWKFLRRELAAGLGFSGKGRRRTAQAGSSWASEPRAATAAERREDWQHVRAIA